MLNRFLLFKIFCSRFFETTKATSELSITEFIQGDIIVGNYLKGINSGNETRNEFFIKDDKN